MDIRIDVDAVAATRRLTLMPRRLDGALTAAMEDATLLGLRELSVYPPQRPPRGPFPYRRTGTLGRSWFRQVRRVSGGAVGEVLSNGNIAPYNLRVQSAAHQAAVHRGVWQTDLQVAERIRPQIVHFFEVRVAAATA